MLVQTKSGQIKIELLAKTAKKQSGKTVQLKTESVKKWPKRKTINLFSRKN